METLTLIQEENRSLTDLNRATMLNINLPPSFPAEFLPETSLIMFSQTPDITYQLLTIWNKIQRAVIL